jgi:hypothetical protein
MGSTNSDYTFLEDRKMRTTRILAMLILSLGMIACFAGVAVAVPFGTAFKYQGRLLDGGNVANGEYDFQFSLYDANSVGNQISSDINEPNVVIIDGYFTVELDFGSGVFDGNERWLEISVRPGELGDPNLYTSLSPRQLIAPAPYALYAKTAGSGGGGGADSDWTISGNDMYSGVSGNVGIGRDTPVARLDVNGGINADTLNVTYFYKIGDNTALSVPGTTNTFVGVSAGPAGTSGANNTFLGWNSGKSNISGMNNTFLGTYAGYPNTGSRNTATGYGALSANTTGNNNTSVGSDSGWNNVSGSSNVFLGYRAGYNETGSNKLYIANSNTNPPLIYGDFSTGRLGLGTITPAAKLDVAGQVKIADGTQAAGKVLTSDTSGLASWQTTVGDNLGNHTATQAIRLDDHWLSGDGGNEGVSVGNDGNVGIGKKYPTAKLEVSGQVKITDGTQAAGKVLTSNASGLASWQTPSGGGGSDSDWVINGSDMYSGVSGNIGIGTTTPFAKITVADGTIWAGNSTLGGEAIYGVASNSGDTTNYGGYFRAYGSTGQGVNATATGLNGYGITASANNSTGNNVNYGGYFTAAGGQGHAVYGWASNTGSYSNFGGLFRADGSGGTGVVGTVSGSGGTGVVGTASNTGEYHNYGGSFEAAGAFGRGVFGRATNTGSYLNFGGYFVADGGVGTGVFARGGASGYAAEFQGIVRISDRDTGNVVMLLGKGLDYAEGFHVSDKDAISPGTVLVIDRKNPGKLAISQKAYDKTVAGIAAGAKGLGSGVRLGVEGFDCDVALAGRVYCNVDATESGIEPGDMLTTSNNSGYAMKAADNARASGAILGKAMEPLEKGKQGQILVLVTLQ